MANVINVGDKIDMVLSSKKANSQLVSSARIYRSKVYDIIDETMIKIAMPIEGGALVVLSLDAIFDMFFYTNKGMHECEGKVVERYKENNVYVAVMEMISPLKKNQRREYYRLSCTVDMKYVEISKEEAQLTIEDIMETRDVNELDWLEGYIVDISGGGIRFVSDTQRENNSCLNVNFNLSVNGQLKEFSMPSLVISSEKILNRVKQYETRVKFINPIRDEVEEIIRYIFEEERKARKNRKS